MGEKLGKKDVAIICGSPGQIRTAFTKYFLENRYKCNFRCNVSAKAMRYTEKSGWVYIWFYLPDMKTLSGQFFDEVIWYGTAKEHPKYRDVLDYVRTHSRKVGEF